MTKKIREVKIHLSFGQNTKQIKEALSLSNYAYQTITKAMIANMYVHGSNQRSIIYMLLNQQPFSAKLV